MKDNVFDHAVAICIDANYVGPATTMLRSLARHWSAPGRLRVRVVHDDLGPDHLAELQTAAGPRLVVESMPVTVPNFSMDPTRHVSAATYKKLFAPDVNGDVERLLILDCDLVVLDDVGPLFAIEMTTAIAAVQDAFNPDSSSTRVLPMFDKSPGAVHQDYFNSGVLLVDTRRWIDERIGERAGDYASDPTRVRIWEQDALNATVGESWTRLDGRWNVFPTSDLLFFQRVRSTLAENGVDVEALQALEADAWIMHFVGRFKPWTRLYRSTRNRNVYRGYMEA